MEEYSPFKDYFNLASQIFALNSLSEDTSLNLKSEEILKRDRSLVNYDELDTEVWVDSLCPDSIEDIFSSEPQSPCSSVSDTDLDLLVLESNLQEIQKIGSRSSLNILGTEFQRYRRLNSLSSSQHSSSSEDSLTDESLPETFQNDYILSAFVGQGQMNFEENVLPPYNPMQYQIMPAKPVTMVTEEKFCILCKRNGETREYYTTHVLKDNRGKVICPVLRKYVCPKCQATGDNAHTLRHCPFSDSAGSSTTETCYTLRSSCGRRRKRMV